LGGTEGRRKEKMDSAMEKARIVARAMKER
jgi:hypothetical protein